MFLSFFYMFNYCVRLEDFKTHAKKFCLQYSNQFINEKELYLFMSFLDLLNKTNILEKERFLLQWFYLT
jgi:hypothetical protein